MNLLDLPLVSTVLDAAYRALMGLSDLLEPLAGGAAAAAAVVLLTLAVRTLLVPVGVSQAKAERDRARLAPRLAELQRRHRNDPERLRRATVELYTREGTTPLAGCLPMLAQAPVVGVVYALFLHAEIAGHGNALLGHTLFGAPWARASSAGSGRVVCPPWSWPAWSCSRSPSSASSRAAPPCPAVGSRCPGRRPAPTPGRACPERRCSPARACRTPSVPCSSSPP